LEIETGEILSEITGGEVDSILLAKERIAGLQYKDFVYPLIYSSEVNNEYLSAKIRGLTLKGPLEYASYKNYLIYNYHEQAEILSNKLEVYDSNAEDIAFKDILNRSVSNYAPDSFFIKDSYLFYVREKVELTSINLI